MNETRERAAMKKDKNQHIQVFVRVRPPNNAEKAGKSATVVDVTSCKEVIVRERPQDKLTKKFTFDRVFGPSSKQLDVYNAVVSPLLEEVLAGYNCTVFAYGQTGTGKTFTMEGAGNDPSLHWQSDTQAGIIPRSLSHLFDELRTLDAQEYSVRVSFLELYNEELFDLLSPSDDASKIRLYEDAARKGAVIIHGLEEVTVHNKSEVYKILEKGSEKRQTAATLMNATSSRSHTVFSITVHIKENTVDGEELLKTGKLNLVDLAGSENVGRSGAVDRRAREAGSINQSLLTLGRVITALVERAPHIPYRESKLTRLLQESLGGRTKTSIIATVSPASVNLEETLSTLDYAHRAKNITNRPEINQKLSKKALLKEYTEEIERLRRDLLATRERNGVYLAQENYSEMQSTIECQGKDIEEKINHIKALEETMISKEKMFTDVQLEFEQKLESANNVLETTKKTLHKTKYDRDFHKHLVEKHATTEKILYSQAQTLLKVADTATDDTFKLHDKIIRKTRVENENDNLGQQFRETISKRFQHIEENLSNHTQDLVQFCLSMKDQLVAQGAANSRAVDTSIQLSNDLVSDSENVTGNIEKHVNSSYDEYKSWILSQINDATGMTQQQTTLLRELSAILAPRIKQLCENKITENLRQVDQENSVKFQALLTYVKDSTDTVCETLMEERDRLLKSITEIREFIETNQKQQEELVVERNNFSKVLESMCGHYKSLTEKEESSHNFIMESLRRADQTCTNVTQRSEKSYKKQVKNERAFEKELHNSISTIQSDMASNMEKNWTIADESIKQGHVLVAELQTELDANCKALDSYKNLVERNADDLQKRTENDRTSLLSFTTRLGKIVSDSNVNQVEHAEQQRHKSQSAILEIGRKFEKQGVESTEWNNQVTAQMRTTQHQVDKFLMEDLRRDTPTGTTPAKREFQYPRKLVTTSPYERILKNFRESRKQMEESDDENETTIVSADSTIKVNLGSPQTTLRSPMSAMKVHSTSTPNSESKSIYTENTNTNHTLIKSASTSDLSFIVRPSALNSSTRSESEMYMKSGNKENRDDEFAKPERKLLTKRLSRTKIASRRILGTNN